MDDNIETAMTFCGVWLC